MLAERRRSGQCRPQSGAACHLRAGAGTFPSPPTARDRPMRRLGLLLAAASAGAAPPPAPPADAADRLHKLFESEWDRGLREKPVRASVLGDRSFDDRWPDRSPRRSSASPVVLDAGRDPAPTPSARPTD